MNDFDELTLSAIRAVAKRASHCSPSIEGFSQSAQFSLSSDADPQSGVVHRLYDAQKRYEQNRAERQQEKAEAAKAEIRSGPVINSRSARIASTNAPIQVRTEHLNQIRERALECERRLVRERADATFTGTPSIRPRSQKLQRTVDDLMRWEDQKQKRRSVQQHRQLEEQKRTCTFRPKVRSSSTDNRWTRNHMPGSTSNGKISIGLTPTSSTSAAFLSSQPLSFQAFQNRIGTPNTAAKCGSAGRQWIKGSGSNHTSHSTLPSYQKSGGDFSFVDSPQNVSPGSSGNGSPLYIEARSGGEEVDLGSGGEEPAPEFQGPAEDSPYSFEEHGNSTPGSEVSQGSIVHSHRSATSSHTPSPVGRSKGYGAAPKRRSRSGPAIRVGRGGYPSIPTLPIGATCSGQAGKGVSKVASTAACNGSPHVKTSCSVVEYSCDWEAVLAIARRGGA